MLVGVLTACSGSSDDGDSAEPTATPTATTPSVPVQPEGAHGVTYSIRNWAEHADDPVVLAYKQAYEAVASSANDKKVYPELRATYTERALREQLPLIKQAWPDDWSTPSEALGVIQSVTTRGTKATVVACAWGESTDYRDATGAFIDPSDIREWRRRTATFVKSGDTWKLDTRKVKGTCDIKDPS